MSVKKTNIYNKLIKPNLSKEVTDIFSDMEIKNLMKEKMGKCSLNLEDISKETGIKADIIKEFILAKTKDN